MTTNEDICTLKGTGKPWEKETKLHEQPWFIDRMKSVTEWLKSNASDCWPPVPDTEQSEDCALLLRWEENPGECLRYLAALGAALHQAFDDFFGIKASPDHKCKLTKPPAHLFADPAPGGGLCLLLRAALRLRAQHGWSHASLGGRLLRAATDPDSGLDAGEWVGFFAGAEKELADAALTLRPILVFSPEWDRPERLFVRMKLMSAAKRHRAFVVHSLDKAT
eukprot:CAMPEP_0172183656 /NCGR_PEP_ID=MMETSP1050-20130122/19114_1 /TAXON_ID=233186 /ORGANISM="Cryptomonas curvata, Strain CCAP979/52" /LENGTH=221 /DNA_ID=CAMNT_0012857313 /DNA_START=171 /DNA_END=833 /DNA_ORIENTATION=+